MSEHQTLLRELEHALPKSLFSSWTRADCAVRFFARWCPDFAGRLTPVKKFGRYIAENMQASCVRTDAEQALRAPLSAGN